MRFRKMRFTLAKTRKHKLTGTNYMSKAYPVPARLRTSVVPCLEVEVLECLRQEGNKHGIAGSRERRSHCPRTVVAGAGKAQHFDTYF